MTQPVAHGYPDWGRFMAQSDSILVQQSNQVVGATVDIPLGFVGGYAALGLFFRALANNFTIDFQFYADDALTSFITEYTFEVNAGRLLERTFPILGPYLNVEIGVLLAASQYDLSVWSAPGVAIPADGSSAPNVLIAQTNNAIAAATAETVTVGNVWPGEAHWTCRSTSANWTAELQMVDRFGTANTIDIMAGGATTVLNHSIYLPARSLQVVFTNSEAAARAWWCYMTGRPLYAGA